MIGNGHALAMLVPIERRQSLIVWAIGVRLARSFVGVSAENSA